MACDSRMEFGLFIPQHDAQQNPTRAIQRDPETIEFAERMGFDEAWIGEHHSSGWEIASAPEVFIVAALELTNLIPACHLGALAALPPPLPRRLAQGRFMLGGPGSLPTEAATIGILWGRRARCMAESLAAVHYLLTSSEPLRLETDWFTLEEAVLQLRLFRRPSIPIGFTEMEPPFGRSLAGRYGARLISLISTTASGYGALGRHWSVVEEQAEAHGRSVSREGWRIVAMTPSAAPRSPGSVPAGTRSR